ncbi:MAG: ABC transporter ATP-binding protein [Dehalococcoidia bacterium]|nr:ABC transporter ATP-binding protein [Dehalococcoidia bacterium]
MALTDEVILDVRELRAVYRTVRGVVKAVDGISFDLRQGETLCVVGESGCGKTATGLSILRLIEGLRGQIVGGKILYHGEDILKYSVEKLRQIRGHKIAMIFQDPQSSLNPVLRVGEQIAEPMRLHLGLNKIEARARALELMRQIGIPFPERRIDEYPHQFSGGMKQRVMIAMALSCEPDILIADEPTTALDVTTKAQIMDIFRQLKQNKNMSIIFITHDMGIVADMADKIVVMYGGRLAEAAGVLDVFDKPQHPYTQGLLKCLPDILAGQGRLEPIPGNIPSLIDPPENCNFNPRCPYVMKICREKRPPEYLTATGHRVACFLYTKFPVHSQSQKEGAKA